MQVKWTCRAGACSPPQDRSGTCSQSGKAGCHISCEIVWVPAHKPKT
ncbi:MAG: hypothetical protein D6743_12330 [Calditrichaeota bacterium]|nr:MAG: hypothetical protein D6743_12330 [Calditrichota bacterium]